MSSKQNQPEASHRAELIAVYEKRLRLLENQRARFGDFHTPPHIQIEIEDIENILRGLKNDGVSSSQHISAREKAVTKFKSLISDLSINAFAAVLTIAISIIINLAASQFSESLGKYSSLLWIILILTVVLLTVITLLTTYYKRRADEKKKLIEKIQSEQRVVSDNGSDTAQA